jgi:hypothetical protein
MDNFLSRAVEELLGRASGPMHLRLIIQPLVATFLAVRAGLRDARQGNMPFLRTFLSDTAERRDLAKSAWKDIGKLFMMALLLDAIYQITQFHAFHPIQSLIVAVVLAILPYIALRGIANRIARRRGKTSGGTGDGRP